MAAPNKIGLDYYPRSVDLTNDRKFVQAKIKYGYLSIVIYDILLELIYSDKGYYLEYTEETKSDVLWDISGRLRGKYSPDTDIICEVIEMLAACELFSGDRFKQGIITSRRVQEVYYKCTVKRKNISVDKSIWLLSAEDMKALADNDNILPFFINDVNNEVNDVNNDINDVNNPQSKVNKSKVNKSNIYRSAVDYLNKQTGAHYKYDTPKTKSLIDARVKEGFGLEDFIRVIDVKCREWLKDPKMKKFLRPETLFGTKFEGYLNQEAPKEKPKSDEHIKGVIEL